jgi:hypothetical protein
MPEIPISIGFPRSISASNFASTRLGIILLVVGIAGWIVLVTSAILLEAKAAKP